MNIFLNILLAFLLCSITARSQNFKPGTVELASGEKLTGLISVPDKINPDRILFKKDGQSGEQPFSPLAVKGFEVNETRYISQVVSKDALPVSRKAAEIEGSELNVTDTVFLKELVSGPRLSLYELRDEKLHFYIKNPEGTISELNYKVFRRLKQNTGISGQDDLIYHHIYRNQLRIYALEYNDILFTLDRSDYTEKDLSKVISEINELSKAEKEPPVKSQTRLLLGVGYTSNKLDFEGINHQYLEALTSSSKGGFMLKLDADFQLKRKLRNAFIRTELNYNKFNYEGKITNGAAETSTYFLNINTVGTHISINYDFVPDPDFAIYLGAGSGINFSSYPKNIITASNPDNPSTQMMVKKVWYETLTAKTGLLYNNMNVEVSYRLGGHPFNYEHMKSRFSTLAISFAYGFSL